MCRKPGLLLYLRFLDLSQGKLGYIFVNHYTIIKQLSTCKVSIQCHFIQSNPKNTLKSRMVPSISLLEAKSVLWNI